MDSSKAPANYNPPTISRKPVRAQTPNRGRVAAPDSTPDAPAKSTGKPIPQIDPGVVNVNTPAINVQQEPSRDKPKAQPGI